MRKKTRREQRLASAKRVGANHAAGESPIADDEMMTATPAASNIVDAQTTAEAVDQLHASGVLDAVVADEARPKTDATSSASLSSLLQQTLGMQQTINDLLTRQPHASHAELADRRQSSSGSDVTDVRLAEAMACVTDIQSQLEDKIAALTAAEKQIADTGKYVELLQQQVQLDATEISRLTAADAVGAEQAVRRAAAEAEVLTLQGACRDLSAAKATAEKDHVARLKERDAVVADKSQALAKVEKRLGDQVEKLRLCEKRIADAGILIDLLKEQIRLEASEITRLSSFEALAAEQGKKRESAEAEVVVLRGQIHAVSAATKNARREYELRLTELETGLAAKSQELSAAGKQHQDQLEKQSLSDKNIGSTNVFVGLLKEQIRLEAMVISRLLGVEAVAAEQGIALASANDEIQKLRSSYVLGEISREAVMLQGLYETVYYPGMTDNDANDPGKV